MLQYQDHVGSSESQIEVLKDALDKIMFLEANRHKLEQKNGDQNSFMVHLYTHVDVKYKNDRRIINEKNTLSFVCLNAGIGFNQIANMGPRSIILTSGTLSPMESMIAEL